MSCFKVTRSFFPLSLALSCALTPVSAQEVLLGQPNAVLAPDEPITVAPSDETYGTTGGGFGTDIGSTSLAAPSVEAAGLVGAGSVGMDDAMWGATDGARAIALIDAAEPAALYSVDRLVRRVLVAGATPPENADGLLAARSRALVRFGAAEEASSLAGAAGRDASPALRRARAEAALIVGRDETLCEKDVLGADAPPSSGGTDTFWSGLRAYCLARTGDPLAAVAVNAMVELGSVDPSDAPLLEALVDESLIDYVPVPHASALTPLRIAMLRSMGRANKPSIESAPLPMIAGLFALESTGAKGALIAAQRLEAVGAIETLVLREMYVSFADSVDGALGRRAKAVRDAEKTPDVTAIGDALVAAAGANGKGGFAQLARVMAPMVLRIPTDRAQGMNGAAGYALRDSMLLGGYTEEAGAWSQMQGATTPEERADVAAVMAVADADWSAAWTRPFGDTLRARTRGGDEHARRALASLAGLGIALRPDLPDEGILKAARERKVAETVLSAAAMLGSESPPTARTLDTVIRALREVGLEDEARSIAIETMISERWR